MTKCPVCEIPIEEDVAPVRGKFNEKEYFFCSEVCKEEFSYNQEKYLANIDLGDLNDDDDDDGLDYGYSDSEERDGLA